MPSLRSVADRIDFIARLETVVGPVRGRVVLDLGSGNRGLWTRAYVARGADVLAVDLDFERCREITGRFDGTSLDPPTPVRGVVQGDGQRLPLRSASVDLVHCDQVLEHVAKPAALLAELRRVLVPGGHCYLTAINRFALRDPHYGVFGVNFLPPRVADRVLAHLGATNPERQLLSEMHYFTRGGFRRLCGAAGFIVVADLKRRERLARHGAIGGRIADLWGSAVRSASFHWIVAHR